MGSPPEELEQALASRYLLDHEIGHGASATVYLARDLKHERRVAIKVLRADLAASLASERFLREITIAAQLQHPHILPLLDSGAAPGLLYFVMPFVEGETLRERIRRGGPLGIAEVVRLVTDVADALAYAHGRGVVHRDIKPDNVMLTGRHAVVMDFGVSKALNAAVEDDRQLTMGVALGTPTYMAPEQAMADPGLDHRVDLYALGVLGYEALCGRPPFTGATPQEVLTAHVVLTPEPIESLRPDVPAELAAVIMRCLAKQPDQRWAAASEIVSRLDPLTTPSGGTAPPSLPGVRRARPWAPWAGAALALAAAGVLLWAGRRTDRTAPPAGRPEQLTFLGNVTEAALSPDGQFVAYVQTVAGGQRLSVQDLTGTRTFELAAGERLGTLAWTAGGGEIGYSEETADAAVTRVIPRLGGGSRVVAGRRGVLSPDGRLIATAASGSGTITILTVGTADTLRLPRPMTERWLTGLAWAPGSDRLALTLATPEARHSRVAIMSLDGRIHQVLEDSASLYAPAWSGERALYYLRPHQSGGDLMRVGLEADGSAAGPPVPVALAIRVPDDSRYLPLGSLLSVSANGRQAALVRQELWSNLARIRLTGPTGAKPPEPFTMGTALYVAPRVAGDGSRIAVFRSVAGGAALGTAATDGNRFEEILTVIEPGAVAWAPSGATLAFTGFTAGAGLGLSLHDLAAGTTRVLPVAVGVQADWGRSGIVTQSQGNHGLVAVDPTSGAARPLVPDDTTAWVFYPRVSPDGGSVAYMRNGDDGMTVRLRASDGSAEHELLRGQYRPVGWSADSRLLYLAQLAVGLEPEQLVSIPAAGGPLRALYALPPGYAIEDVARDGSFLVANRLESRSDVWRIALDEAGGSARRPTSRDLTPGRRRGLSSPP